MQVVYLYYYAVQGKDLWGVANLLITGIIDAH